MSVDDEAIIYKKVGGTGDTTTQSPLDTYAVRQREGAYS